MKHKERTLMTELMLLSNTDIYEARDEYSSYDCYSSKAIIELKIRDKYYPTKMIELDKMVRCTEIAKDMNKDFVYVVKDPQGIHYLNITENLSTILRKPATKIACPKTTEFANNSKVDKLVYNINMIQIC